MESGKVHLPSLNGTPFGKTKMQRVIVGEVTCKWQNGTLLDPSAGHISHRFEKLILGNLDRGYKLHSFQLNQIVESHYKLLETIIAVFISMDE